MKFIMLFTREMKLYLTYKGKLFDFVLSALISLIVLFSTTSFLVVLYPRLSTFYLPLIGGFTVLKATLVMQKAKDEFSELVNEKKKIFNFFVMKIFHMNFHLIGTLIIPLFIIMIKFALYNGSDYDTVLIINSFHNLSFYLLLSSFLFGSLATVFGVIFALSFKDHRKAIVASVFIIIYYIVSNNLFNIIAPGEKVAFWMYLIPGATFGPSVESILNTGGSWFSSVNLVSHSGVEYISAIPGISLLLLFGVQFILWVIVWNTFIHSNRDNIKIHVGHGIKFKFKRKKW